MNHVRFATVLFAALLMVCLAGCYGEAEKATDAVGGAVETATEAVETAGEDVVEAATDYAADVADMAPEELKAKADELKGMIAGKEDELKALAEKMKGLSPADLAGEKAKDLQSQSDTLTEEIGKLKEKWQAYTEKTAE
jgi:gas vesicle protein